MSLFQEGSLAEYLAKREKELRNEIETLAAAHIADDSTAARLRQRYTIVPPKLREGAHVKGEEDWVDVSYAQGFRTPGATGRVRGVRVTYTMTFDGKPGLFQLAPSSTNTHAPRGAVTTSHGGVTFSYDVAPPLDSERVKREYEQDRANLEQWLAWVAEDVARFNASLQGTIESGISTRRAQLKSNADFLAALSK